MKKYDKLKLFIKNNVCFLILILAMTAIYIYQAATNYPWYDELYTYYSFIRKGPLYGAIHWPVPNNHIGFSVLSGCFSWIGIPVVSLRVVSVLASVASLIMIYCLGVRWYGKCCGVFAAALLAGANLVFRLAFQGRGYSLAMACFLAAIICSDNIFRQGAGLVHYILLAAFLTMGLYIVPSSVYWVVPLCLSLGMALILKRDWNTLVKAVITGVIAAVITIGLYAIVWLAIGANLISKDPESSFFGVYQVNIILSSPIKALSRGIEYMLATPYIQSIERKEVIGNLTGYLVDLFDSFYYGFGVVIALIAFAGILNTIRTLPVHIKNKNENELFEGIFSDVILILVPFILIIQSVLPYKRVLSFFMVPVTMEIVKLVRYASEGIANIVKGNPGEKGYLRAIPELLSFIAVAAAILMTGRWDYREPLGIREKKIDEILDKAPDDYIDSLYYTDDFQKYVFVYKYGYEPTDKPPGEAEYCMMPREMMKETVVEWPLYFGYDEAFISSINNSYTDVAENDFYILYKKK